MAAVFWDNIPSNLKNLYVYQLSLLWTTRKLYQPTNILNIQFLGISTAHRVRSFSLSLHFIYLYRLFPWSCFVLHLEGSGITPKTAKFIYSPRHDFNHCLFENVFWPARVKWSIAVVRYFVLSFWLLVTLGALDIWNETWGSHRTSKNFNWRYVTKKQWHHLGLNGRHLRSSISDGAKWF